MCRADVPYCMWTRLAHRELISQKNILPLVKDRFLFCNLVNSLAFTHLEHGLREVSPTTYRTRCHP
jgi:hypothetical protein